MSNTELLLKEIEGLPANYMGEILDFVGYLKHKAPPAVKTSTTTTRAEPGRSDASEAGDKREADQRTLDPRLIGAVNPDLLGTVKTVGDIIGPFHDIWENGY
jgi:hypothetical protein